MTAREVLERIPVRRRLIGATVVLSSVMLAGVALLVLLTFRAQLASATRRDLDERRSALIAIIRRDGPAALDGCDATALLRPGGAMAQILDATGRVVATSAAAPRTAMTPPTPTPSRIGPLPHVAPRAVLTVTPLGPPGQVIVLARSLGLQDQADQSLGHALRLGGPLVLVLILIGSYAIARQALRPVEEMQAQAATMSREDLAGRLTVPPAKDELAHLAHTLNELLDRVAQAAAHERAFIANASHELRTPLARLQAGIELALIDGREPELQNALQTAGTEARRLGALATDLLTLAALDDASHVRPMRLRIDLADHLEQVIAAIAPVAAAADRTINTDLPPIVVTADAALLRQAVENLIDNALTHGTGPITVTAAVHGSDVHIAVRDDGPGLDLDLAEAIQRFRRGPHGQARPGAGLGLAIVDAVAKAHGGHLEQPAPPLSGVTLVIPHT